MMREPKIGVNTKDQQAAASGFHSSNTGCVLLIFESDKPLEFSGGGIGVAHEIPAIKQMYKANYSY